MAWAPSYATAEELAAFVRIPEGDFQDEEQLELAIAAASRAIDRAAGRQFGKVDAPEARIYTARYSHTRDRWMVAIDDLMTTDGLEVRFDAAGDETYSVEITGFGLRPANAHLVDRPWEEIVIRPGSSTAVTAAESAVQVTAKWGWAAVPDAVKEACLLQASRLLARRDSPYGVAGSPETGGELRLLAKVDPDVEVALAPFKRRSRWVFA